LKHGSSYEAVLFDLDGTLIEFEFKAKESREAIFELLRTRGIDVSLFSSSLRTQALLDDLKGATGESYQALRSEIYGILDSFEMEAFDRAKAHPGSLQTLIRIAKRGIKTALVTNSGRAPVNAKLGKYGFTPYFDALVTRDEMARLKPAPDGIILALEKLSVQSDDALYVGDSILDIEASRVAGVKCVSVASGLYQAEELAQHSPDFLIHRIEELEGIVFPSGRLGI